METPTKGDDYIDFNHLQNYLKIPNTDLLLNYLREIYKDLITQNDKDKKPHLTKISFIEYINLPIIISEKLFASFDHDRDGYLNLREFSKSLLDLYTGTFEQICVIIFDLLDFDHDERIIPEDVKLLLSYLPLNTTIEYKFQMASLSEIDGIIQELFDNKKTLDLTQFIVATEKRHSDAFLQILCFLYERKPFTNKALELFEKKALKNKSNGNFFIEINVNDNNNNDNYQQNNNNNRFSITNSNSNSNNISSIININPMNHGNTITHNSKVHMKMQSVPSMSIPEIKTKKSSGNLKISSPKKNLPSPNRRSLLSPVKKLLSGIQVPNSTFQLDDDFVLDNDEECKQNKRQPSDIKPDDNIVYHEDWITKFSKKKKSKTYYLILTGMDLFYFKDENKTEFEGMHHLSGAHVKNITQVKINDTSYYSFIIQFKKKKRTFYTDTSQSAIKWQKELKRAIGNLNFLDYYEILDNLGEGKFGVVKLCQNKTTHVFVAVKKIEKSKLKELDIELLHNELDIMKIVHHPSIVTLIDLFESSERIYIVMEYYKGGNLTHFVKKKKFDVSEYQMAKIIKTIAQGIQYLHGYGIVHRDLKSDNIMMTSNGNDAQAKIMDFGLSKIMGVNERSEEGFGTLSFVAPEVLLRKPYNKQIDIWSIGVILYYSLSGKLPFDDENDDEEKIAKMTVFQEVRFPDQLWNKKSREVIQFISKCLIKEASQRMTVNDMLDHSWLKNYG